MDEIKWSGMELDGMGWNSKMVWIGLGGLNGIVWLG